MPVYCSDTVLSIALTASKLGYKNVHGHDVHVRLCIKVNRIIDIEMIYAIIRRIGEKYDHRVLDDILGEGALIEDLLKAIIHDAIKELGVEFDSLWAEARVPHGTIIVFQNEGLPKGG